MKINQIAEGYSILPSIDRDKYQDREHEGLEGPIMMRNGQVLYYDKRAGKYYNPDIDMFVSDDEFFAMDNYKSRAEVGEDFGSAEEYKKLDKNADQLDEEARDAIRDFMGMGMSRAQAEAEARKMYPDEFDQPARRQSRPRNAEKPVLVAMHFFNVSADQESEAKILGLKQTKSGKWYKGEYTTSGANKLKRDLNTLSQVFGEPKRWEPKKKANEGERHGNDKMYDKCWSGYKKVPGKKRGEKGSCVKEDDQLGEVAPDAKTAMGAKIAGDKLGAKGSGQRMATAMDKIAQGQALTGQFAQEIAPFVQQLEKILANPMLRQKFLQLVKQAEQVQEGKLSKAAGAMAMLAALYGAAEVTSAKHTPLGKAMAVAAQQGDAYAAKHLEDLDFYADENPAIIAKLSNKYLKKN